MFPFTPDLVYDYIFMRSAFPLMVRIKSSDGGHQATYSLDGTENDQYCKYGQLEWLAGGCSSRLRRIRKRHQHRDHSVIW